MKKILHYLLKKYVTGEIVKNLVKKIMFALVVVAFLNPAFGEEEGAESVIKSIKKLQKKGTSTEIVASIDGLKEYDTYEVSQFLVYLIAKKKISVSIKVKAAEVLSAFSNEKFIKYLKSAVKKGEKCNPHLLRIAGDHKYDEFKKVFRQIVGRSKKTEVVVTAVKALGKYQPVEDADVDLLISLLDVKKEQAIRKVGTEVLGGIQHKKVVATLINYVEDLILEDMAQASLERLTGKKLGCDQSAWTKWWEKNGGNVTLKKKSVEELKAAKKRASDVAAMEARQKAWLKQQNGGDQKVADDNGDADETEYFYGLKLKGKNILFVLDRSGSMGEDIYTAPLGKLKEEFLTLVNNMSKERSYGVVFFGGALATFPSKGIDKASDSHKKKTEKFLLKIKSQGTTPISGAMEYAFEKVVGKKDIDTIYLLSDGNPDKPTEEVRTFIQNLNSGQYITIHTISIGMDSQFLRDVAGDHGGDYVNAPL